MENQRILILIQRMRRRLQLKSWKLRAMRFFNLEGPGPNHLVAPRLLQTMPALLFFVLCCDEDLATAFASRTKCGQAGN